MFIMNFSTFEEKKIKNPVSDFLQYQPKSGFQSNGTKEQLKIATK